MPTDQPFALHRPRWQTLQRLPGESIPPHWRPWLEDRGSLTRRLVSASEGDFRVEILRQFVGLPTAAEAQALRLPARRWALIREVLLVGRDTPWVFARSILPVSTLTGRLRRLRHLDNRPLGQLLFSDNSMTRGEVEVASINGASLGSVQTAKNHRLWGRRSVFRLSGKPLLVCEIFLPGFDPSAAGRLSGKTNGTDGHYRLARGILL